MIRLIPQKRYRVSNQLAVVAAVLLAITSFAGLYGKQSSDQKATAASEVVSTQAEDRLDDSRSGAGKRKLNISTLLFGHG